MYDIQLATTNEDIASTFTVMRQLRTHLDEQAYVPLITEIQKNVGYLLAVLQQRGCAQLHLDSGVQRHEAHRFYLRERMDITCYHFCRELTAPMR